ncbi:MAG: Na/Pi cotransporter family protein [Clostridiales bacterium]|nr:Na/Pi cotransporter family protein [Candidatus Blautia equi]
MGIGSIFTLLGGLGLFLFGMKYMGEGLELAAGPKMKDLLEKLTRNRFLGFLLGALVTVVIQSSSATTVMVMGFINAEIMDLAQATGVIFGSNIGTTITSVLIALDVSGIAPVCIGLGALLMLYAKKKKKKYLGQVILGFGLLFEGLHTMSGAMAPLKDFEPFQKFIMNANNPLLGFILGALLCAIIQSSSAAVGVLQALAMQGCMPLGFACYIICGINVGSSTPPLLAALNAKNNAKRAAIIYLLFNVFGAILFIPLSMLTPLNGIIESMIPSGMFQISVYHILFKVVTGVVLLPMVNLVVKWTYMMVPKQAHESAFRLEYIDPNMIGSPAVLQLQVQKEVGRMGDLVKQNLQLAAESLMKNSLEKARTIRDNEEIVDYLASEISGYLTRVNAYELPVEVSRFLSCSFNVLNELEQISDHAVKILTQTERNIDMGSKFSDAACKEIQEIYDMDAKMLEDVMNIFAEADITLEGWKKIRRVESEVGEQSALAKENHMARMKEKKCTFEQGLTFTESMNSFVRIANHCVSVAGNSGKEVLNAIAKQGLGI